MNIKAWNQSRKEGGECLCTGLMEDKLIFDQSKIFFHQIIGIVPECKAYPIMLINIFFILNLEDSNITSYQS